jgi:putative intracellular protease/amidase
MDESMKILSFLFPGFTALDLIGPTTVWGLMPGAEFQTVARTPGPVKVDMGLEIVATHSFDSCWSSPDVLFVLVAGTVFTTRCRTINCLTRWRALATRRSG